MDKTALYVLCGMLFLWGVGMGFISGARLWDDWRERRRVKRIMETPDGQ